MVSELLLMQLASDQRKKQTHESPQFPCSAYYTNWSPRKIEGVPWHWHRELEFMVVVKGQVWLSLGEKSSVLGVGDGFFCNSGSLHQIRLWDCEYCSVNSLVFDANLISGGPGTVFDEKYIYPLISARAFPGIMLYHSDERHQEVLNHVRTAHKSCREEAAGYEYEVRYQLARALLSIFLDNQEALEADPSGGRQMNRVRRMLDYIHQNYAQSITISQLAASAHICERECQRCFRQILHQSPMDYIQQYRIQMAGKMLLETRLSVLEVGLASGFSNPSHFCKVFKKHMNRSPESYRQENLGEIRAKKNPS